MNLFVESQEELGYVGDMLRFTLKALVKIQNLGLGDFPLRNSANNIQLLTSMR